MFRHIVLISSAITLAACTQPAATVELRGSSNMSMAQNSFSFQNPVAPVTQSAFSAPVQAAPVETVQASNSISVSDLQPAAGTPSTPVATKPAIMASSSSSPFNAPPAPAQHAPTKPVTLTKTEDVPTNAWTGKTRDSSSFVSDTPAGAKVSYIWPVTSRKVLSPFGNKSDGMTIASQQGEPVWAAADGEVVYVDDKLKGYGKMVIVKHGGSKTTTYAHLARYGVEKYDRVKQGDIVGYVGTTGSVKEPQLYFSMRDGAKAIDPKLYLDHKVAGL